MKVSGAKETARNFRQLASFVSVPLNATSRFALQPTLSTARRNVAALSLDDSTGALGLAEAGETTVRKLDAIFRMKPLDPIDAF